MTKLKTLKDLFVNWDCDNLACSDAEKREITQRLRNEAINWINHINETDEVERHRPTYFENETILWIRYFFNLTAKVRL
jgi:hypothetical protein